VLIKKYSSQFKEALEKDEYSPITVKNEEEYREVVAEFPVYKRGMEQVNHLNFFKLWYQNFRTSKKSNHFFPQEPFPRKFPFSRFIPKVYGQAKAFIGDCVHFMQELQLTQSEVSDTIRRNSNLLFAKWSDELREFISARKPSLIQVHQLKN
jgi:exocyst complex component 6